MNDLVPDATLRLLARTGLEQEAAAALVAGQHRGRLLALRDLAGRAAAGTWPAALSARLAEYRAVLDEAERTDPEAVRRVLLHPAVGNWAARCRAHLDGGSGRPAELTPDLEYLGALAVAAGLRAGLSFVLEATPRDGLVPLPSLGAVGVPEPGAVLLIGSAAGLQVEQPGAELPVTVRRGWRPGSWKSPDPRWLPLHPLLGSDAVLEDLDPFRVPAPGSIPAVRPGGRLPDAQRLVWQKLWRAATVELERVDPRRNAEARALLRCAVPLDDGQPGGRVSATLAASFGAVYATAPTSATELAATLVRELANHKLVALAELAPLYRAEPRRRHWAPWRSEPRSLHALFRGAYAHLALADYWQRAALAARDRAEGELAWSEHARCAARVGTVLPALSRADELTEEGRTFVTEMTTAHRALDAHPAPSDHRRAAAEEVARAWTAFRAIHGEATPG